MLSKVLNLIFPIQLTLLTDTDVITIQGTKVLESREIRTMLQAVREGAPARDVLARVIKYDGNRQRPQWRDMEQGTIVDSVPRILCPTLTIQQTSLKPYAMLQPTFPRHHAHPSRGNSGKCVTRGTTTWC